jgi:hypothetical protein
MDQGEEFRQLAPPSLPPGARPVATGPAAEVFPLQPGTRYEYEVNFGLGTNGPFAGTAVLGVTGAWQVETRVVTRVAVESRYFGRTRRDVYMFTRDADWIGMFEKAPPDKITAFMPTSLEAGRTWQVATGEGTGEAELLGREAAAGYQNCYKVHYVNPGANTDMTLWLAPRVGLVQADVTMRVSGLPLRGTLKLARLDRPLGRGPR